MSNDCCICHEPGRLVDQELRRVATQYRESDNFLNFICVYLMQAEEIEKALCDIQPNIHLLGIIANVPRCWCNIKKRVFFGLKKTEKVPYFGFQYPLDDGPISNDCLGGFDGIDWKEPADPDACADAATAYCCDDPSYSGFCGTEWNCGLYPEYEDYCFDDDIEYTKIVSATIARDRSDGTIESVLSVARILWGDQVELLDSKNGNVVLWIGRNLTDDEKLLADFYKTRLPIPMGVSVDVVDNIVFPAFGFNPPIEGVVPCNTLVSGFCNGHFLKRY